MRTCISNDAYTLWIYVFRQWVYSLIHIYYVCKVYRHWCIYLLKLFSVYASMNIQIHTVLNKFVVLTWTGPNIYIYIYIGFMVSVYPMWDLNTYVGWTYHLTSLRFALAISLFVNMKHISHSQKIKKSWAISILSFRFSFSTLFKRNRKHLFICTFCLF